MLREYLPELGQKHFVYAASVFGKGGAALAYACAELGFKCTLLMPRPTIQLAWVDDVQKLGTEIVWTDLMPIDQLELMAWDYARDNNARHLVAGFTSDRFSELMVAYMRRLPFQPMEIWCPVVSGTMALALEQAFPNAELNVVSVVKNPGYVGKATVFYAPEKFIRNVAIPPPFPSWPYSDAKVWRFAQKHGGDDAVIWNSNA